MSKDLKRSCKTLKQKTKCFLTLDNDLITKMLKNHAKSVPSKQGFTKEEFSYRKRLKELMGKKLEIEREDSNSITLKFPKDIEYEIDLGNGRKGKVGSIYLDKEDMK
ncbi:MAG: hypothetical protein WC934_04835 [Acidithiobacillus sp.]|jgi:hypothetical protein|uniref:hypothetical protein n=1 Tax=Acidithiobacillus sp. TaxID=1872118 RepID=UPI00355FD961